MNILVFYRYNRYCDKDERLHLGFVRAISQHPKINLKIYGKYCEDYCPDLVLTKYNSSYKMDDIVNLFHPDIIIGITKSRLYNEYNPRELFKGNLWLPSGWNSKKYNIKNVILEEDYHNYNELDDQWYYDNNIDLICHRHYNNYTRLDNMVKKVFFPFSVDTKSFYPRNLIRKNKVCFVGSLGSDYYDLRKKGTVILNKMNLIDIFSNSEKLDNNYIQCLQEYTVYLSTISTFNITPAKIFEIMASGGLLLQNDGQCGMELLFDRKCYINWNLDNLVENTIEILNDKYIQEQYTDIAVDEINKKHTHYIRVNELYNILEDLL